MEEVIQSTAAIYFVFYDDKFDKTEHPNKLILARSLPTVADVCSTMKMIFFNGQDVVLSCAFTQGDSVQEYNENSPVGVPVNERGNVIIIKNRYQEGASKITPQSLQVSQFLQQNNIDNVEILNIFQKQKVTLDNMKYLKDTDLQTFGITHWETRMAILDAIQKYYVISNVHPTTEIDSGQANSSDEEISSSRDLKRRNFGEGNNSNINTNKKFKSEKRLSVKPDIDEPQETYF
eukprot:TRINITY_DN25093_c0_g1_i1.p1 TRINITY_DN25093_c0_g1~~TRINITY_DN25093_c0_g1_i1.p1  ORF type:complete len:234 (+),score=65.04 TRINITY_DN25093_c0_g1_i1:32-733(+)